MLDVLMSQILARMSVISEQRGRTYDGISVNGGERSYVPSPLIEKPMVDWWRESYQRATTPHRQRELVSDALQALKLARRAPLPVGMEPEYGSPQWKRFVADSTEEAVSLARRFHVSKRYINQVRAAYRR